MTSGGSAANYTLNYQDGILTVEVNTGGQILALPVSLMVYPIPVHDRLHLVSGNGSVISNLKIRNITGDEVFAPIQSGSSETSFSLEGISPGEYILETTLGGQLIRRKIVKE